MKKFKDYSSVCESTTAGPDIHIKKLTNYYNEKQYKLNLSNNNDQEIGYFSGAIKELKTKFDKLIIKALKQRSTNMSDYLTSGYVVSEIDSSLKAEGEHSSRKKVDAVIKSWNNERKLPEDNNTNQMIINFYQALMFVNARHDINETWLNMLYRTLTENLDGDILSFEQKYRQTEVYIGKDQGLAPERIDEKMKELISFINSPQLENDIQTKAIIAEYIFENIHPYPDFNGRMGRLLHLWILIKNDVNEFWKLTFLSEAIYAFKHKLDTTFRRITKAKRNNANIDMTYFIAMYYEILIEHTEAYIDMKRITNEIPNSPSRFLRLFIIDLLCIKGDNGKWYTIKDFKERYPDYSTSRYTQILNEIRESGVFEIRGERPVQFRLKEKAPVNN